MEVQDFHHIHLGMEVQDFHRMHMDMTMDMTMNMTMNMGMKDMTLTAVQVLRWMLLQ